MVPRRRQLPAHTKCGQRPRLSQSTAATHATEPTARVLRRANGKGGHTTCTQGCNGGSSRVCNRIATGLWRFYDKRCRGREQRLGYASIAAMAWCQEIRYEGRWVAFIRNGDYVVDPDLAGKAAELVGLMIGYAFAVNLGWADGPYTDEEALTDARIVRAAKLQWRVREEAAVARRRRLIRGVPSLGGTTRPWSLRSLSGSRGRWGVPSPSGTRRARGDCAKRRSRR